MVFCQMNFGILLLRYKNSVSWVSYSQTQVNWQNYSAPQQQSVEGKDQHKFMLEKKNKVPLKQPCCHSFKTS